MRKFTGPLPAIVLATIALSMLLAAASVAPTWSVFSATTINGPNALSAASSFYRAQVLGDSPVSYWRLGELSGSTAIDERGTSNGTYAGGYVLGSSGALVNDANAAVDLDGLGGRIRVPDAPALRLSSRISIEAWVKPDTLAGTRWIVNKGSLYYLYISDGTTYFGIRTPAGSYLYLTTTAVTTAAWQHLVGTYDGTTMSLYRNGAAVAQASFTATIDSATSPLFIGAFDATGSYFDGGIDEVAVYATGLTSAQVLTHYQRGALTQS